MLVTNIINQKVLTWLNLFLKQRFYNWQEHLLSGLVLCCLALVWNSWTTNKNIRSLGPEIKHRRQSRSVQPHRIWALWTSESIFIQSVVFLWRGSLYVCIQTLYNFSPIIMCVMTVMTEVLRADVPLVTEAASQWWTRGAELSRKNRTRVPFCRYTTDWL